MLAPHHAEDAELSDVGIAAQDLLDACVFVGSEAMLGRDFRRNLSFGFYHFTIAYPNPGGH